MQKLTTTKPILVMLYGFPGAGKTHFAKQIAETLSAAHVHGDRIRYELFEKPRYDKEEDQVVEHIAEYMAEEFIKNGANVVFDCNVFRKAQRRVLRSMATKVKAASLLVWLQIDIDTARLRISDIDRRQADSKYAPTYDKAVFDEQAGKMQNPKIDEDFMVISGKHAFSTQRSAVMKKLYELGLVRSDGATAGVVKPGLVNLVPNAQAGRVDLSRRNIVIR